MKIRDRIKRLDRVKASELLPNPRNWRTHPQAQQDALRGVLAEVGWVDALLVRETPAGLQIVDGHMRAETTPDEEVPVLVLDLDDAEADKVLATFDPIAGMAESDPLKLDALLREIDTGSEALQQMLADLAEEAGLYQDEKESVREEAVTEDGAGDNLQQKFKTAIGQTWAIGEEHKLAIDDASDGELIKRLKPKRGWDGIVTDPPYEFDATALDRLLRQYADVATVLAGDELAFRLAAKWSFRLDLIWEHRTPKKLPNTNVPLIYHAHILIIAASEKVKTGWTKPRPDFGSIIRTEQEYLTAHGHGKSAELFRAMLAGFQWRDIVDPFAGSGGTLIAAEQDGRRWTGIEIDPARAAICLDRAERFGLKPVLIHPQREGYNAGQAGGGTPAAPKRTRPDKEIEHV